MVNLSRRLNTACIEKAAWRGISEAISAATHQHLGNDDEHTKRGGRSDVIQHFCRGSAGEL